MSAESIRFRDDFLLGVSSAAAQTEGGNVDSNWLELYKEGGIKDGTSPAVADMHYEKFREDTFLMRDMGIKENRFGIEWGRLVPEEGRIDMDAVSHYREEIMLMKECGIRPLMTIHHFSNPMWFERKGGWLKKENCKYYLELVSLVLEHFGDLVCEYVTINEPNVYATNSYCFGIWYPGKKSLKDTFAVLENMAHCHIEAYSMIHEAVPGARVGFANHLRVFEGKNILLEPVAKLAMWLFQGADTWAMSRGIFRFPMKDRWNTAPGEYSDFNGINYYSRSVISGFSDGVKENSPRSDLDWEIYPEGIVKTAAWLSGIIDRPIYITENGTCDNEDTFRSKYIYDHLKAINSSELPFARYYHWCFTDNWEWAEGQSARFGLVHNDYDTQERTIKESGRFYSDMIKEGGVTEAMFDRYVKGQKYRIK